MDELEGKLKESLPLKNLENQLKSIEESDFVSGFGEEEFKLSVEKAKEYIESGDIMQVVCSQRMSIPFNRSVAFIESSRQLNPSPTCIT